MRIKTDIVLSMNFYADLHIHSKYSRATSRSGNLPTIAQWAQLKGLSVVGTGDFTHPAWRQEIEQQLLPSEPGLFRLRKDIAGEVEHRVPGACRADVRFCLTVEISTIYKKGDRTRKVHHVVLMPDMKTAMKFVKQLDKIGNLHSDGRPILGLDSRDLLEIVLESGDGAYLIPAHIWTPWFAMLGSKSGFDSVEECYGDLSDHIFALETGLSSDPGMNWRVSALDKYRLVSNSDAHSPSKLAREACIFDCDLNYFSMMGALHTGDGYVGTVEFFPEEGKYHFDGHRKCEVCSSPDQTRTLGGKCPVCRRPLTLGVMYRIEDLADRTTQEAIQNPPKNAGQVRSLVPLSEVISEILNVGSGSKRVQRSYQGLLELLGPELRILWEMDLAELRTSASPVLVEALERLRAGKVTRDPGFDGQYGAIRLFEQGEIGGRNDELLFSFHTEARSPKDKALAKQDKGINKSENEDGHTSEQDRKLGTGFVFEPDEEQARAVHHTDGVLIVEAGPGSGKTSVLVHRLAFILSHGHVRQSRCLVITFTRRAAESVRHRLEKLLPDAGRKIDVMTLHSLGLEILRKSPEKAGLASAFAVSDEVERMMLMMDGLGVSERKAKSMLNKISRLKTCPDLAAGAQDMSMLEKYDTLLAQKNLLDFDDLIAKPAWLLQTDHELASYWQQRYEYISVDEAQDLDPMQEKLLLLVAGSDPNLCVIGDPDQSIYGFRGVRAGVFERLAKEVSGATTIRLKHNYRSAAAIVTGAVEMMNCADSKNRQLRAIVQNTELIGLYDAISDKAEAEFIVHSIEQLIGGHSFFSIDSGRSTDGAEPDLGFGDIAVFYRTEKQSELFIQAMERSGIPYMAFSHRKLMDLPAVRAIAKSLRQKPGTGDILLRIKARQKTILKEYEELSPGEMDLALDSLSDLAVKCATDTNAFLMELLLASQVENFDPRSQRVSLMTIHSSKGLEFPLVFLTGCEDGLLPLRFGSKLASDMDEERRLFYVGMTRAMRKLILTSAKRRILHGAVRKLPPSPFALDVKKELLLQIQKNQPRRSIKKKEQLQLF